MTRVGLHVLWIALLFGVYLLADKAAAGVATVATLVAYIVGRIDHDTTER